MQLVLVIYFVSCYCTKYVFGVTNQSSENAVVKKTDTTEEVNVLTDNYHELLKRVIINEIEISEQKRREEFLKHELENTKRYVACQIKELNDISIDNNDKLNETRSKLMKTMISFTQSLTLLNETIQEQCHSLEISEKLLCEENVTEYGNTSDCFHETISSPGYPYTYSNCLAKIWIIDVGSEYSAKIQFTSFDTEEELDVVTVYDAANGTFPIGSFSGDILPPEIISTGRYMFVTFTSDVTQEGTGFSANVYKVTSK